MYDNVYNNNNIRFSYDRDKKNNQVWYRSSIEIIDIPTCSW